MTKTGIIYDKRYLEHFTGQGTFELPPYEGLAHQMSHPESPERIANVQSLLVSSGFIDSLVQIKPREADRAIVELVHKKSYVETIKKLCEKGGGRIDIATPLSEKSYNIALLAIGGCIAGLESIMMCEIENAYALIRPPGHHAERSKGMGFCLFNNVAISAEYLKQKFGLSKILILDWDVHHGNGTQSIFYDDPSILYISIHQEGNYPPELGTVKEKGDGKGEGYTINIPLPPGTGDTGYISAMREVVQPACEQFKPEFILVSAGQDPNIFDPLGRMSVTYDGFEKMTSIIKSLAEEHCQGRLLIIQEGGYCIVYQAYAVISIIETLSGKKAELDKPYQDNKYYESDFFKEYIERVVSVHKKYWNLKKSN